MSHTCLISLSRIHSIDDSVGSIKVPQRSSEYSMTSGEASGVTSQESVYESILNLVGHDHVTISASYETSRPTSQHRALV